MFDVNKYNKKRLFDFNIPKDFTYESLADLFNNYGKEQIYIVRAMFLNKKSKFGTSPVVCTDNCLVNLPKHLTETVEVMLTDTELIQEVNKGNVGFKIYPYESNNVNNRLCYSIEWVNL